jgi:hypothetical protein
MATTSSSSPTAQPSESAVIDGLYLDAATVTGLVNVRMVTLKYPGRRVEVLAAARVPFG